MQTYDTVNHALLSIANLEISLFCVYAKKKAFIYCVLFFRKIGGSGCGSQSVPFEEQSRPVLPAYVWVWGDLYYGYSPIIL